MRVVYWNSIPSPYMVDRFNAVADRGAFDFEVWFNEERESDRSWTVDPASWRFASRYLPRAALPRGRRLSLPAPLLAQRPDVMVSLFAEPSFVAGWALARALRVRTAFRLLPRSDRWNPARRVAERLKPAMFRRVDAVLASGEDARAYALSLGTPAARVHYDPQVVDVERLRGVASLAPERRRALRAEHGLSGPTFLCVGRLWWGKGVGTAIEAVALLARRQPGARLLVVGDGADEAALARRAAELDAPVSFLGFREGAALVDCYALADAFVFPTLGDPYGLVVDEAMAAGLPVISSTAAGEIRARVRDGETGYLVPPEQPRALADRMAALAAEPERGRAMGRRGQQEVARRTPVFWAERFEASVRAIAAGRATAWEPA